MKSKVIFIIVPSFSKSDWLNRKMMAITKCFIEQLSMEKYDVEVVSSYDEINNFKDKADLLVVSTAGNVIVDRDHLLQMIENFPSSVGIMGHIIQYEDDVLPYLHEQFFIINTNAVETIDLTEQEDFGFFLSRSSEDMHDGHAPLYVTLGGEKIKRLCKFGTRLMSDSLMNGYEVRNFDNGWRYPKTSNQYVSLDKFNIKIPARGYCYPLLNTDIFETAIKSRTVLPELDEAQQMFISAMNEVLNFNVLNVYHYEFPPPLNKSSKVITTANGFIGELMALESQASEIVFFDINKNNLDFKKYLYENWNGHDYESFAKDYAHKFSLHIEPAFVLDQILASPYIEQVNQQLFPIWRQWKDRCTLKFIHCDLIVDYQKIIKEITFGSILNTSTILSVYPFTVYVHDIESLKIVKDKILSRVTETQSLWLE